MKIVADTSALIAVLLDEPEADAIIEATVGHEIIAPESVRFEVGNVFVNVLRRNRQSLDNVTAALQSFAKMEIRYLDVDIAASVLIAHESGLLSYDAYVLSCAMQSQAPLMTLDRRLQSIAQGLGAKLLGIGDERNPAT